MSTTPKRYTRFELMDTTGRVVVHCGNTQSLEQDECRTLKVFIDQPARVKDAELIQAEPLVPMWFCSHCDWRNAPSHYTFCPGCGSKIKR